MSVDPNEYDIDELRAIAGVEEDDGDERSVDADGVDAADREASGADGDVAADPDGTGADAGTTDTEGSTDDAGTASEAPVETPFTVDLAPGSPEEDAADPVPTPEDEGETEEAPGEAVEDGPAPDPDAGADRESDDPPSGDVRVEWADSRATTGRPMASNHWSRGPGGWGAGDDDDRADESAGARTKLGSDGTTAGTTDDTAETDATDSRERDDQARVQSADGSVVPSGDDESETATDETAVADGADLDQYVIGDESPDDAAEEGDSDGGPTAEEGPEWRAVPDDDADDLEAAEAIDFGFHADEDDESEAPSQSLSEKVADALYTDDGPDE